MGAPESLLVENVNADARACEIAFDQFNFSQLKFLATFYFVFVHCSLSHYFNDVNLNDDNDHVVFASIRFRCCC